MTPFMSNTKNLDECGGVSGSPHHLPFTLTRLHACSPLEGQKSRPAGKLWCRVRSCGGSTLSRWLDGWMAGVVGEEEVGKGDGWLAGVVGEEEVGRERMSGWLGWWERRRWGNRERMGRSLAGVVGKEWKGGWKDVIFCLETVEDEWKKRGMGA
ncbi:hypothetical protein Pmani_004115 [Petrolisthes manimaculis]|uniref:Uncharacterized protein n=1 Tax=Petrolisthes manimaculis TaxID=1843537 RepID=A0AAE1QHH7_9EUCA|nr:hypothetical protein Pmani_004115 [Petrolisthes manimaculis]